MNRKNNTSHTKANQPCKLSPTEDELAIDNIDELSDDTDLQDNLILI